MSADRYATYRAAHRETLQDYNRAWHAAHPGRKAAYNRAWYEAHRVEILERMALRQREFSAWLRELYHAMGCADCGTQTGRLEHSHDDHNTKVNSLSRMYGSSPEKFWVEFCKGRVRCTSCHKQYDLMDNDVEGLKRYATS